MVVWMIGLSREGKTTLSKLLYDELKPQVSNLVLIDGDVIRDLFGNDVDYSVANTVDADEDDVTTKTQSFPYFLNGEFVADIDQASYLLSGDGTDVTDAIDVSGKTVEDFDLTISADISGVTVKEIYAASQWIVSEGKLFEDDDADDISESICIA